MVVAPYHVMSLAGGTGMTNAPSTASSTRRRALATPSACLSGTRAIQEGGYERNTPMRVPSGPVAHQAKYRRVKVAMKVISLTRTYTTKPRWRCLTNADARSDCFRVEPDRPVTAL